jgi:hypothetical protein
MLLFLFSVLLYGVFVWFIASRPVRPWNLNRRTGPVARGVIAFIVWPLVGFLLFWIGILAIRVGEIMMLPVGVGLRLFRILW